MRTVIFIFAAAAVLCIGWRASLAVPAAGGSRVELPAPATKGSMSLEESIQQRRSVRDFKDEPLTKAQISQLCWAAQGITYPKRKYRAAPSAGALYPLEIYIVSKDGVDHYVPDGHALERHLSGDLRGNLKDASLFQDMITQAPVTIVIAGVEQRLAKKYGNRAERYMWMEAGHVGQNIQLQATALGLGSVPIGAFQDEQCKSLLQLPDDQEVLYIFPVGHPD
jgi:SagB-type dehydrogenase family enzyme